MNKCEHCGRYEDDLTTITHLDAAYFVCGWCERIHEEECVECRYEIEAEA